MGRFDPDQNISSAIALSFIMTLSALLAWFTVDTGREVADMAENFPIVNTKAMAEHSRDQIGDNIADKVQKIK